MRLQPKLVLAAGGSAASLMLLSLIAAAQSVPPPVLAISATNGTQLLVTITNGLTTTNYEIYRTPVLNSTNFGWTLEQVGDIGQTNFLLDMEYESAEFFRAGVGSDWDLDGVPNSQDANPVDAGVGALSITIDSPLSGATLN